MGIIFCNNTIKLIPNLGRSQTNTAKKITVNIILKITFFCLKLLRSEVSNLSPASLFFLPSPVLKSGCNIHITNKINIINRIRRTMKIAFCF